MRSDPAESYEDEYPDSLITRSLFLYVELKNIRFKQNFQLIVRLKQLGETLISIKRESRHSFPCSTFIWFN